MKGHTQERWAKLVAAWQSSGQTAKAFCEARGLGYASFCQWRKRLAAAPGALNANQEDAPAFIDLSSLGARPDLDGKGWHIVLRLGDGIELCLRQGG